MRSASLRPGAPVSLGTGLVGRGAVHGRFVLLRVRVRTRPVRGDSERRHRWRVLRRLASVHLGRRPSARLVDGAGADGTDLGGAEVWAAAIHLVATVWFNVNTFAALQTGLTIREQNLRGWTPEHDRVGLLSRLQLAHADHSPPRQLVAAGRVRGLISARLNMVGSVFFMAAAIAAFVRPGDRRPRRGGHRQRWHLPRRPVLLPRRPAAARPSSGAARWAMAREVEGASDNEIAHERGMKDHG